MVRLLIRCRSAVRKKSTKYPSPSSYALIFLLNKNKNKKIVVEPINSLILPFLGPCDSYRNNSYTKTHFYCHS